MVNEYAYIFCAIVMAEQLRPLTSIPEVLGSNPGPAVAPLGKVALSSLPSLSEETLSCHSCA